MKRLLLLLPLLLLAACKPAEPPEPTPRQISEVLLRQATEIQDELQVMVIEAKASGDWCAKADTISAGLEMLAAKWGAVAVTMEGAGEMKEAIQARGVADSSRARARKIRRDCR